MEMQTVGTWPLGQSPAPGRPCRITNPSLLVTLGDSPFHTLCLNAQRCQGQHEKEKTHRNFYVIIYTTLFTTAQKWKQPKCPLAHAWKAKLWSSHTEEYYSAIKRDELPTRAIRETNLRNECQVKGAGSQRQHALRAHLHKMCRVGKPIEIERRLVAAGAGGELRHSLGFLSEVMEMF